MGHSLGTPSLPPQNTVITVHRHQGTCSKMTLCSTQEWLLFPDSRRVLYQQTAQRGWREWNSDRLSTRQSVLDSEAPMTQDTYPAGGNWVDSLHPQSAGTSSVKCSPGAMRGQGVPEGGQGWHPGVRAGAGWRKVCASVELLHSKL